MSKNRLIKAVFFDIDGTLLSFRQNAIPESAQRALDEAGKRGLLLFAATGRNLASIRGNPYLREVKFSGFVTMNGQYCAAGKQVVHANPMHPEDVEQMMLYLENHSLTCMFQCAETEYINRADSVMERLLGAPYPQIRDPRSIDETIYQLSVLTPDGQAPSVYRQMPHSTFTSWNALGMDIVPVNGNKWVGIEKMLAHYGISVEETAAIGDGDNDIEMLQGVGFSIAMGNAPDNVKAIADYTTDDVDNDGIEKALRVIYGDPVLL